MGNSNSFWAYFHKHNEFTGVPSGHFSTLSQSSPSQLYRQNHIPKPPHLLHIYTTTWGWRLLFSIGMPWFMHKLGMLYQENFSK